MMQNMLLKHCHYLSLLNLSAEIMTTFHPTSSQKTIHALCGDCVGTVYAGGKVTGSISVGGFPQEKASFSRVMGYCQQEDVHVPYVSHPFRHQQPCRVLSASCIGQNKTPLCYIS